MGREEFSRDFAHARLRVEKAEPDQSFGEGQRTEGSLLTSGAGRKQILHQEGSMTRDPFCGTRVEEKESEFQTQFAGKKYFFCSEECRKEFENQPDEYIEAAA